MRSTKTLLTLLVCVTVVFAGCAGTGGLAGDSGNGANEGAAAGNDNGSDSGDGGNDGVGGGANDDSTGEDGTNEAGATGRSTVGSGGGGESDGGASGSNADAGGPVNATDWLNFSEPGRHYVFEFASAENGSGELVVDTSAENIRVQAGTGVIGAGTVDRTIPLQGDDISVFGTTDTTGDGEAVTDSDIAATLVGVGFALNVLSSQIASTIGEEQVEVGYSDNTTEVTGMGSYAGIECYETTYTDSAGNPSADICLVPGEAAPHTVLYNTTTGEVDAEVTLTEYGRE